MGRDAHENSVTEYTGRRTRTEAPTPSAAAVCTTNERHVTGSGHGALHHGTRCSRELRHGVHGTPDTHRGAHPVGGGGVHDKRLLASVVKDRSHDIVPTGQLPADLDLAIAPLEPAAQLEDTSRPRRAADDDLRALAQLMVGRLRARGLDAGDEKSRHLPRALDGLGG